MSLPTVFTLDEVAARLHKSRRWLQVFLRGRPIGRLAGRTRLLTEHDIVTLIEALPCPSSSSRPETRRRRTSTSAGRTSESQWIRAAALTGDPSLDPSSSAYRPKSNEANIRRAKLHLVQTSQRS
jgi:hypothetical protein